MLFEGRYNAAKQLHSQLHYIWLNDTPVGFVVKNNNSNNGDWNIYAIHTDHLNTPRLVTNQDGAEVWRWASDAFGEGEAVGSIEFNLRFPGQYYDGESGLHYNYFRDYNAQTGRYVQSDPIGLQGGLNTYGYVNGNPINYVDPTGQAAWIPGILIVVGIVSFVDSLLDGFETAEAIPPPDLLDREENLKHTQDLLDAAKTAAEDGCIVGVPCGGEPGGGSISDIFQQAVQWCKDL